MRYFKTVAAAGIAVALSTGPALSQIGSADPSQIVDTDTQAAGDPADSHRSSVARADVGANQADVSESAQRAHHDDPDQAIPGDTADSPISFGPVHDVITGSSTDIPPGVNPSKPIGAVKTNGALPDGIGYTSFPGNAPAKTPHGGPGSYTIGKGCHVQCITSGVAYPRGFGAELVVKTNVDADIFISLIADTDGDGDGDSDFSEFAWSDGKVDDFRWTLDHLEPGQKYYAMAAATDENDKTAHAFGEFTTLSQRDIYVSLGDVSVSGGPDNVSSTSLELKVNEATSNFTPGQAGIQIYKDVARYLDLRLLVIRKWAADICEAWQLGDNAPSFGYDTDWCLAYHYTSTNDIDLDTKPAGKTRWTQTEVHTTIETPDGAGDPQPPGFGDPYYFSFDAPVSVYVTYS